MSSLTPFISRTDLTSYLGRTVTTDAGALIAVDAACDMVRTLAEQTFNQVTNDVVTLDGQGTDALLLPERPVSSVSLVKVSGTTVTDYVLNDNGILFRKDLSSVTEWWSEPVPPRIWPAGRQNIQVTYTHGYADADFPRDVRRVALEIAARMIVQGVAKSEVSGTQQIVYGTNSTDLTNGEKMILRKYKQSR